jgi:hypothetical protein
VRSCREGTAMSGKLKRDSGESGQNKETALETFVQRLEI